MATKYSPKGGQSPVFDVKGDIYLTSGYGYRSAPTAGASTNHKGADLVPVASNKAGVRAIAGGTVTAVYKNCTGSTPTAGNYVFIKHENSKSGKTVVSKYLHLKHGSVSVSVGDKVTAGQKIGVMGTTGASTGNHLHFQLEWDGVANDPLPYALGQKTLDVDPVTQSTVSLYDPTVGAGYQPDASSLFSGGTNSRVANSDFVKIKNIAGVFGLPYQFLPTADVRLSTGNSTKNNAPENIGSEYAEKIIERIPLVFLAPGKASFMTKYSTKNKKSVLQKFLDAGGNDSKSSLEDLLDKDGRYYTFEYDPKTYYKYVNPMCRIAARYLNIHNIKLSGQNLDNFNWETYTKQGISSIGDFGTYTSIPFYVDTDTSISESFSNSTTASQLASTVNTASDMAKELNFLLGYSGKTKSVGEAIEDSNIASSIQNVTDMANKLLGTGGFFENLGSHLVTVASGGKLVFPEIWSDSSFSRSYSLKFKFISPDPSNLSVFLNVLVPLFHLIGLVAPQMPENNPNGYINPFLVRGIYKGFFNIDMGIITDMSVTKGAECQWTPEGVPTSIEVDITIKDLYNAMSITKTESTADWRFDTMNNTALMDYIANLCGINIYKPEITRIIEMWYVNNFENRVSDFFEVNIWGGVQQKVQNTIMNLFR